MVSGESTATRQASMPKQIEHKEGIEESRPRKSKMEDIFVNLT